MAKLFSSKKMGITGDTARQHTATLHTLSVERVEGTEKRNGCSNFCTLMFPDGALFLKKKKNAVYPPHATLTFLLCSTAVDKTDDDSPIIPWKPRINTALFKAVKVRPCAKNIEYTVACCF